MTAAYVFVNVGRAAPSGREQVRAGLAALGSEAAHLAFMVVDVESGAAGDMTQAGSVSRRRPPNPPGMQVTRRGLGPGAALAFTLRGGAGRPGRARYRVLAGSERR